LRIAIYSRKSKQTDQGDSIANQIAMCKDYANAHFDNCEFYIYEDEGFSGGNTDRPMFKQLIKDIDKKRFDVLVCYRLDRISRNVANFAETLEILDKHNVGFVSIKEQFNTTTPMGKAMMYISSVFAQLERDTIAERITDNMSALAKSGRYLGFKAPQGYKKVKKTAPDGKQYNTLEQDEEEIGRIKMFFDRYYEWQSINQLETYCLVNGLKTRQGYTYKCISIRRILTHPVYAAADKYTYEYFRGLGAQMYDPTERWDGTKGIAIYRVSKHPDPKDWLVGVGEHEPIINGTKWIKIQEIIEGRRGLTIRRPISKHGILSGILRCGHCGDYMRPFSRSKSTEYFYYVCSTKETSRKQLCDVKNIRGDIFDRDIVERIKTLLQRDAAILKEMHIIREETVKMISQQQDETHRHKAEIGRNEVAIKNLVMKLAEFPDGTINKHIAGQIKELDERNNFLRHELVKLGGRQDALEVESMNYEIMTEAMSEINNDDFNENEFAARRNVLKTLINKIAWDGEEAEIFFC